jgi:hypothetical protein
MKNTDRIASAGMIRFVLIILGIAVIIAAVYFVFLTPGVPDPGMPAPHAIDQGS